MLMGPDCVLYKGCGWSHYKELLNSTEKWKKTSQNVISLMMFACLTL